MKFALAFLAVVGMACALPAQRSGLKDDLDDFLNLIPKEEFVALYHKYENDPDVQKIVAYLKSSDFAAVMHIIAGNDQVRDLVNYLEGQGVPVIDLLNRLADRLGLPHWPTYSSLPTRSTRSIRDFIDECLALLPINDIVALALDKLANSESFQNLYLKISEIDGQKLHDDALAHPEIADLVARLNNLGVDTKKVWEVLQSLFGWSYSSRKAFATYGLKDDLDDFLALIPTDKIIALYHKYENDPDVQKIVAYLKSSDFAAVMHIIAGNEQVRDLVNYLESQGVPVVELLNKLADRLGLPHWPGYSNKFALKSTRSIRDFIDEFLALLPINDIVALALDKLANSEAFQNLYLKISEVDGQKLHDDALAHPEIADLVARLNNLGVDTKKIWEVLQSLFGWSYSSRKAFATYGLKDDLDDFLALIPTDKFIALYHKYENDPDVQKIVAYLKSSDFAAVMHIIAGNEQVRDLVNYLESQGVPVVELLNKLADRLGLPHWPTYSSLPTRSTRSIRDFIDEAMKLIPMNDIVALALDKLANSESFQNLYLKISEVDGQKLHDDALAHPEIADLVARLNNLGVDTKKIWEVLQSLFGWA